MSRRIQLGALAILALSISLPRSACGQVAKGQLLVQPVVGVAFPYGSLKKAARSGYTLGVSFDYMIADFVSIGTDIQIASFRRVSSGRREPYGWHTDSSLARKFIQFGLTSRFYLTRHLSANPFLEVGGSLFGTVFRDTLTDPYFGYSRTFSVAERLVVGYQLGGGLDSELSKSLRAILRANYYSVVRPDRRGYLHYWTVRAGLGIRFRPL
jgi:hypothetical protein